MSSSKNLFKMARKWQKLGSIRRKRISLPKIHRTSDLQLADKGHFYVYTADYKRLMVPLVWLNNEIFIELLNLSEEEFGLPRNGPIMLPCDAFFMQYVISLIDQGAARDQEKALLLSVVTSRCSSSSPVFHKQMNQQILGCSC